MMHATCIDIDPCCVHMAYVQLSLLHIPATVVHGNALSMEVWGTWHTPAHVLGGWTFRLRGRVEAELLRDAVALERDEPVEEIAVAARHVAGGDAVATGMDEPDVAVLERANGNAADISPVREATSLAELFEQSLASGTRERSVFDTIDQLTLF
ncbi:hypothetical protein [Paraburkholderia youngii]|uniref:hypothetical protein n=1 Tax=Paraburkholderia youngii TaxID=2782701 RepID=UPI003D1A02C4